MWEGEKGTHFAVTNSKVENQYRIMASDISMPQWYIYGSTQKIDIPHDLLTTWWHVAAKQIDVTLNRSTKRLMKISNMQEIYRNINQEDIK